MKSLLILVFTVCMWTASSAQNTYFIYLQSENNNPFYLRNGEKIQSSLASGYIILSGLKDSTYAYAIGFPGGTKESKFSFPVNKDRGFLIKVIDGVIHLFDLQTLSLLKPAQEPSRNSGGASFQIRDDAFTRLLARAVKDSTLLLVQVDLPRQPDLADKKEIPEKAVEKKEIKTEAVAVIPVPDTAAQTVAVKEEKTDARKEQGRERKAEEVAVTQDPPKTSGKEKETDRRTVKAEEPVKTLDTTTSATSAGVYSPSVIIRRSESSTTEGFGLVYHDNKDGVVDTIRILIPNPKTPFRSEPADTKDARNFLDVSTADTATASADPAPAINRKPCERTATENDFLKLRRNMAAGSTEDNMISVATRAFSSRCYSTEQVRHLGNLFLTNYGKYRFFAAAWPRVSDPSQFAALQSEINDDYYLQRFKDLLTR